MRNSIDDMAPNTQVAKKIDEAKATIAIIRNLRPHLLLVTGRDPFLPTMNVAKPRTAAWMLTNQALHSLSALRAAGPLSHCVTDEPVWTTSMTASMSRVP